MKRLYWLCICLAWSGCVATDVGNPQTDDDSQAELKFEAFEEQMPNALMLDDGVELTHAWIATERIRLGPCDEDEGEELDESEDVDFRTPTVTNLLTSTSFPRPPQLSQPQTVFCKFEVRVRPLTVEELPAGAPADLADVSMLVRGYRKDGNPFVVSADFDESFELDGDIRLDVDALSELVLGFAVNGWVTQRDIGPLVGSPIVIDSDNNTEVYEAFEDAVHASARLFETRVDGEPIADELGVAVAGTSDYELRALGISSSLR